MRVRVRVRAKGITKGSGTRVKVRGKVVTEGRRARVDLNGSSHFWSRS